ncbi:hypothetical protein ANN_14219 [Periplaneta americana]|uniref:Uncharacterized protein n=1 Tax=Periplaneta americana TaxID=6978 RepID=A0ABQ8SVQ3_PERAM|nr:hypothetical protein ANN_14219 [Periplaneta americana]
MQVKSVFLKNCRNGRGVVLTLIDITKLNCNLNSNIRRVYAERIVIKIKSVFLFQDTLTRCCGFRGIKGHRARRSYSILSRSAQRGTMGASNAGQESTDYSGNSVREEVLPGGQGSGGSCGSSVKEASGTSRSFRRQESGYVSGGRNHDPKSPTINWVTSPSNGINHNNIDGQNYKRSFSVIISASQCNESDLKTTMVHSLNGQNKQVSQNPITSESISDSKRKEKRNAERTKKNAFWSIFKNITGPANTVEESRKLSVSYSPTPATPNQSSQFTMSSEVFDMIPVCRSNSIRSLASSSNNVSNSSLRDVERGALEDELTAYMQELRRREEC